LKASVGWAGPKDRSPFLERKGCPTMLQLTGYRLTDFISRIMPRWSWPCTCIGLPRYSKKPSPL